MSQKTETSFDIKQLVYFSFGGIKYVSVNIPEPLIKRNVLFPSAVSGN